MPISGKVRGWLRQLPAIQSSRMETSQGFHHRGNCRGGSSSRGSCEWLCRGSGRQGFRGSFAYGGHLGNSTRRGYLWGPTLGIKGVTAQEPIIPIIAHSDRLILLSGAHLSAALRFSRQVAAEEIKDQDRRAIRDYATASVFAAVAALEAYANELFFQPMTTFPEHSAKLLGELWELSDRKPIIDKFNLALRIKNKPTLNEKSSMVKNLALLIDLRNALVHFKPAWDSEAHHHRRLSDKLRDKFKPSRILEGPIFPYSWATVSCTEWAIDTVLTFADHFTKQFEILPPNFQDVAAERARDRRVR